MYMCYYLLIMYGAKGIEETLLPTRKFHEAVFDMQLWILTSKQV